MAIPAKTGGKLSIINRNSATSGKDNIFVYWVSPSGVVQTAPDSRITETQMHRMREYRHWRRCEAHGAREIEKISLIISKQMFEQKKRMKVQQTLRELQFLKEAQMLSKIRAAQGFSANDVEMNRKREKFWALRQEAALHVITSEFNPSQRTTGLEMEVRPQSTSPWAHIGKKKEGILA